MFEGVDTRDRHSKTNDRVSTDEEAKTEHTNDAVGYHERRFVEVVLYAEKVSSSCGSAYQGVWLSFQVHRASVR